LVGPEGEAGYLCSELWGLAGTPGPSDFALGHSARDRHTPNGRTLYISSYGISERFRGKGLGRSLFRGFLDYARETVPHEEIILLVSETWTGARSIYADEGFSRVLVIPAIFPFSSTGESRRNSDAKNAVPPPDRAASGKGDVMKPTPYRPEWRPRPCA
jgi:ribosomal-protein-alanine N-acetyltransferase